MADQVQFELVAPERLLLSRAGGHGRRPGRGGRFRRAAGPRAADLDACGRA